MSGQACIRISRRIPAPEWLPGDSFGGSTQSLLETTLINNPGVSVSDFCINGNGNNTKQVDDTILKFSDFNSGPFPKLFLL